MADLKSRLDAERAKRLKGAGPTKGVSLTPATLVRQAKEKEPLPPTIEDLEAQNEVSIEDMETLRVLVAEHIALGKIKRKAEKSQGPLTNRIKAIVSKSTELQKMVCAGGLVSYYEVARASIKKEALLAHGILPSVIAECTETKNTPSLKIRSLDDLEED